MCVANYSAVSVPMLLAPARDSRLSCAQCRRHTSVWSDSRSVRRTNDAGSPAHGQTPAPLISVSALTHISVSLLVWKLSEPAACVLPCYAQGRAEFRKDHISFSFFLLLWKKKSFYLCPGSCLYFQTHASTQWTAGESWGSVETTNQSSWLLQSCHCPTGGDLSNWLV